MSCNEFTWLNYGESDSEAKRANEETLTSCVTFAPNNQPAPLGLTAQFSTSSGSDHIKSTDSLQITHASARSTSDYRRMRLHVGFLEREKEF